MKSKVMDRPLFKGPAVSDDQVENVGIMQGFMEDEDDLMSLLESDDVMNEDEDENNQTMERSPRSPEILMNNLRGDMRSMDARVEELADLVGYNAAMDTPEEVLMLLQPVLAQQGIGGLPAAGAAGAAPAPAMPPAMPPEMGMPPPETGMPPQGMPPAMEPAAPDAAGIEALMAPQAPPPMDQAPVQMRDGGYVQRFQAGSDEEGVTPVSYPPELVKYAQEQLVNQRGAGNLKQAVADVMPTYRDILGGGDRRTMQGQALMDVAQAGLRLASGRNAQGANVAGGSFASQLASAAEGLPGKLAERAGQFQQEERAIKLAALKSAESNVDSQRKLFSQIVKSAGQSPFGKGLTGGALAVLNNSQLMQKYAEGTSSPDETNIVESARLILERPTTEFYTDDKGARKERVIEGIKLPHVAPAFQQRQSVLGRSRTTPAPAAPVTTSAAPAAPTPYTGRLEDKPAERDPAEVEAERVAAEARKNIGNVPEGTPASAPVDFTNLTPQQQAQLRTAGQQWDKTQAEKGVSATTELPTLWANIDPAIGLPNQLLNTFGRVVPLNIAGQYSRTVAQASRNIKNVVNEMIETFQEDKGKMSDADRTFALKQLVDLEIDFFQNPANFKDRVLTLGLGLEGRRLAALEIAKNPLTDNKERNKQENAAAILATQIKKLGLPPFINTQAEYANLKIGDEYLVKDKETDTWVPGQKKPPGFRDQKKR